MRLEQSIFYLKKKKTADDDKRIFNETIFCLGSSLKVVSTMSAGYDHLDVPEIKRRGIKVGHTPEVLTAAVSEIAVMLLLNAARRANEGRKLLEA